MQPLYRYFGQKNYLESFIEQGEIFFNSLSYFLSCEDESRRDTTEDACIYIPEKGLITHNKTTGKSFTLTNQKFISQVNRANHIFVFCTSTTFDDQLSKKFQAPGCVEILDVSAFKDRMQAAVEELYDAKELQNKTLLSGQIDYYDPANPPGTRHACPDQIVMSKPKSFLDEQEYRFAFAEHADAFDVNNVRYFLSNTIQPSTKTDNYKILKLGSLTDICRIIPEET
ncbi:MAG: hypothetical protein V4654_08225 [Bdellovibrionota bacterium]